jgi:glycerophosphoryl diester phosphodiesterase
MQRGINRLIAGAMLAVGAMGLLAGCSLPVSPGGTPANAIGKFGVLGEIPHLHLDPVPLKAPRFSTRIIAHRGYSSRYPENTLSAIRAAVEAGADMVEIDVQLTKDNAIVVMHDQSVYRTTNGAGLVKDLTLEQIRSLDAGSKFDPKFAGELVPTLEEALDAVHGQAMLNIEVKNVGSEGARTFMAQQIAALVSRKNYSAHVQVMAFDSDFMQEMRQTAPGMSMALLAINNSFGSKRRQAVNLKMDGLNLLHNTVSADEVRDLHKAGIKTHVYTVNRQNSMLKALRKGVDGLITDYPEVAAAAMDVYFNGGVIPDALLDGPDGEDS